MMSRSYLLRNVCKKKFLFYFMQRWMPLWNYFEMFIISNGKHRVKIGSRSEYSIVTLTHSLTYLLIPKANMATPPIGGRGHKKKKVLSWFSVACIIGDWNFALILLRWRDASPWSFHRSLRRIQKTHIFRYFSRLLKCWSKNTQTNNKTRKQLNTRKR